jgi:predicted transcriptional regulator YdeE
MELPPSQYASFDVYVANGYDSENSAMDEWLELNKDKYTQKLYDNNPYAVEFYDERFHGNDTGSIVEIWIPIEKK